MLLIPRLSIFCIFTSCIAQQLTIFQDPPLIVKQAGQEALIDCEQKTTDHDQMYWYHQERGQGLKLIDYMIRGQKDPTEGNNKDIYEIGRTKGDKHIFLKVKSVKAQNQGLYFCASSDAQ
uniref:Ig-like domain-containing protein n=2 Tax=Pyxicephalus adspersus TaxID=30357 RepID=A0AAV2ZQF1_PYXAD|nr:TPA: hypothetical protein GDO54_004056 [Pyxicephalus adspersus]